MAILDSQRMGGVAGERGSKTDGKAKELLCFEVWPRALGAASVFSCED